MNKGRYRNIVHILGKLTARQVETTMYYFTTYTTVKSPAPNLNGLCLFDLFELNVVLLLYS